MWTYSPEKHGLRLWSCEYNISSKIMSKLRKSETHVLCNESKQTCKRVVDGQYSENLFRRCLACHFGGFLQTIIVTLCSILNDFDFDFISHKSFAATSKLFPSKNLQQMLRDIKGQKVYLMISGLENWRIPVFLFCWRNRHFRTAVAMVIKHRSPASRFRRTNPVVVWVFLP